MSTVLDFVKQSCLPFSPIKYDDKDYKPVFIDEDKKWHQLTFLQSMRTYKEDKYKAYNGVMLSLNGLYLKYICFDTYCETSNNFILKMIADNNLNNVSTPSYSHLKKNLTYKNHYYFKIPNNYIFNNNQQKHFTDDAYGNLDIIYYVAEHKDNKIDFENISEISPEILELLFIPKENNEQDDEQEEVDKDEVIE